MAWLAAGGLISAGVVGTSAADAAPASLVFVGAPRYGAPPSMLGPYVMSSFGSDSRDDVDVSDVPGPTGDVTFSEPLTHRVVGIDWNTWSHDYTGDVYYSATAGSVTLTLPSKTRAFYLYAEPNTYDTFNMSATASDDTSSGNIPVAGEHGARYFGFYSPGTAYISSVTLTSNDDSAGFAIGEFGIARSAHLSMISMGDSYSSGEGNPPFEKGTDTRTDKCHRSLDAWPHLASKEDSTVHLIAHIACSGAEISALTNTFKTEPAQIKQLKALPVPQVITLTLGGNDIGFASILQDCFIGNCVNDAKSAEFNITRKGGLTDALTKAYEAIEQARPKSRLLVVGYPNIFPTTQTEATHCGWLTDKERPALVHLAGVLDSGIKLAAQNAGVDFVSTLHAVLHHELCTAHSWMYPIGLSGGQLRGHPTLNGQEAIAADVETALDGL
jgi:lysophospholipase L1-like esterase